MNLFRLISWATNSNEEKKVKESTQLVEQGLGNVARALDKLGGLPMNDAERKALAAVQMAFVAYRESTKDVVDMAAADAASALLFMMEAEQKVMALQAEFEHMNGLQDKMTAETVAQVASDVKPRLDALLQPARAIPASGGTCHAVVARLIAGPIHRHDHGDDARSPTATSRPKSPAPTARTRSAPWPRPCWCSRRTC